MKRTNDGNRIAILTSWKALNCTLQASDALMSGAVDGAIASETTASCWIVRGPITASTALCATAFPVPKAAPIKETRRIFRAEKTKMQPQPISEGAVIELHMLHISGSVDVPWAMVEPMPPSTDPPCPLWTGAGGGALRTAQRIEWWAGIHYVYTRRWNTTCTQSAERA